MFYVYVLQDTAENMYYGSTDDLKRRMHQHARGNVRATRGSDYALIYYEAYRAESDARRREQQLKRHGQAKRWLKDRIRDSRQS